MNIALGFGSTETAFEESEIAAFKHHLEEKYPGWGRSHITDAFVEYMERWLAARAKGYQDKSDEFRKAAEFPDRYSYYHSHIAHSASCIVAIFMFTHINRRHALSPDGWATLQTQQTYHAFSYDL